MTPNIRGDNIGATISGVIISGVTKNDNIRGDIFTPDICCHPGYLHYDDSPRFCQNLWRFCSSKILKVLAKITWENKNIPIVIRYRTNYVWGVRRTVSCIFGKRDMSFPSTSISVLRTPLLRSLIVQLYCFKYLIEHKITNMTGNFQFQGDVAGFFIAPECSKIAS